MCLTADAAAVVVVVGALLAVTAVRALNMPAVNNRLDRNIYMMSDLNSDANDVLPITPPLSP